MSFFKAYDMRGAFGKDFDLDTVYRVGLALPRRASSGRPARVLVGRDCRLTSPDVRDALVAGLVTAGAQVVDLGLSTTPMVYFFTAEEDFDLSVMVTASHNPPSDNGMKVSKRGALPMGADSGLKELERDVNACEAKLPGDFRALASRAEADGGARLARYAKWMHEHSDISSISKVRFAVDCSNGMASLFAAALFPGAVILNDVRDGSFPAHSPNPLDPSARADAAAAVKRLGLDCAIVFDGDADRCVFLDENGEFVQPDYLVPVIAGRFPPGGKVIHDVRTSRGAIEAIRAAGFEPKMVPVGHAFAKVKLREYGAVCGGELAGHYYFRDFHCCDSGAFAALKTLEAIAAAKGKGMPFSELMRPVSGKYANSGELNFETPDKDAAIARALDVAAKLARETGRSEMDGWRIEYDEGWISIRKSNTEPYLRLIAECDSKDRLRDWTERLGSAICGS